MSDFDEIRFCFNLIADLTRVIAEREGIQASSHDLKMQHAFSKIRGFIGVVVPHERCITSFWMLFPEALRYKFGLECDEDIFVGTPEMFQGVEKEIIIVCGVRNSVVEKLGEFEDKDKILLTMSRAKSFFWVVGSSPTFMHHPIWREYMQSTKLISVGQYNNYFNFENHKEW